MSPKTKIRCLVSVVFDNEFVDCRFEWLARLFVADMSREDCFGRFESY